MLLVLKNGWHRLRRSQTVKLLTLEFVVVLAGVLGAQLLQGWFAEREERARAETSVRGIGMALHNSAELAQIRRAMALCMRNRIEQVRDALATTPIDQAGLDWVRVPEQNILDDPGIDAARPLITKIYGPEAMASFSLVEYAFDNLYAAQDDELAAWSTLSLLNPENGPVSPELRGELQAALAEAQRTNRLMFEVSGVMIRYTSELETPVHQNTIDGFAQSYKLCADMAGFTIEDHSAAAERGELPDGTPLHPRLIEDLAAGRF